MRLTNSQALELVQELGLEGHTPSVTSDQSLQQAIQNVSGNLARALAHSRRTMQFLHDNITGDEYKDARNGIILEVLNTIVDETLNQLDDWVGMMGVDLGTPIQEVFTTR